MAYEWLYFSGFLLVILYLLTGLDDFIWDIASLLRRKRKKYKENLLKLSALDDHPPKLLAVVVAAWQEAEVLGEVIGNFLDSTQYPRSMYHVFLGVYPNDLATLEVARRLEAENDTVHVVVNEEAGPTSKAQNLNYVLRQLHAFQEARGWSFAAVTIHDAEDVVHPYELKVTNALLGKWDALQFPVFPLIRLPKFSNFFSNLTAGTYADEFAENHFITLVSRTASGAFVPSAGTGFVLSKKVLALFGEEDMLPRDSLTEDFSLSLTLLQKGVPIHYVLERVERVNEKNRLTREFVATRSLFPNRFSQAVRQKTRWILGITMQSLRFRDIFCAKGIRWVGRYSMYKDLKAKVGNLLILLGYPVLIYYLLSLFFPLPPIFPLFSLSWYCGLGVTVLMLERQLFRGVAIYHVYGLRSVFFSCLLPPFLPIRLIWGNIINLTATLKAYARRLGSASPQKNQAKEDRKKAKEARKASRKGPISWDKTQHEFIEKSALQRFQRKLGDVLLEKGFVSPGELVLALEELEGAGETKEQLGTCLQKRGTLGEEQLLCALSQVKQTLYVEEGTLGLFRPWTFAQDFSPHLLRTLLALPLLKTPQGYIMAFCNESPGKAHKLLSQRYPYEVKSVFASKAFLLGGLRRMEQGGRGQEQLPCQALAWYQSGQIDWRQLILLLNYQVRLGKPARSLAEEMGLLPGEEGEESREESSEGDTEEGAQENSEKGEGIA